MKKQLWTLFFAVLAFAGVQAQVKTPQPSPLSTVKQTVGLTDVEIEYSRPSARGRVVFGADGVVPFGEMWRTGANASTKISFSDDVKVEGKELKAGKYAIYTIPNAAEWTVIFYKDLTHWGVPEEYKAEDEALRVMVKPQMMGMSVETFLINMGSLRNNAAQLEFIWDKTLVEVNIEFNTDAKVTKSIESALAGPAARDYYLAARYYYEEKKDLNQALAWSQKANELAPRYWQLYLEAQIFGGLERYSEAIAVAERSKAMAEKENDPNYVRNNEKLIEEYSAKMNKKPAPLKKAESGKPNQ